jgi:hypothetical protein
VSARSAADRDRWRGAFGKPGAFASERRLDTVNGRMNHEAREREHSAGGCQERPASSLPETHLSGAALDVTPGFCAHARSSDGGSDLRRGQRRLWRHDHLSAQDVEREVLR